MTSLYRVIKQANALPIQGVVQIPDLLPEPFLPSGEEAAQLSEAAQEYLRKAREEGEDLIQQMKSQAEGECAQLLQQANDEADSVREQARQEGLAQGIQQKTEELDAMLEHVGALLAELLAEHKGYFKRYERELADFAIEIASKLLAKKIETDDYALLELVHEAMEPLKDAEWITIELCDEMPELIERLEQNLAQTKIGQRVEIQPRDIAADAVVLSTPTGVIDATLSTQIKNLRSLFEQLDE